MKKPEDCLEQLNGGRELDAMEVDQAWNVSQVITMRW